MTRGPGVAYGVFFAAALCAFAYASFGVGLVDATADSP